MNLSEQIGKSNVFFDAYVILHSRKTRCSLDSSFGTTRHLRTLRWK